MSSTDLYILNRRSTTHLAEFRNGWGSAPRCWDYVSEKYFGTPCSMFNGTEMKKVWQLAGDERLLYEEKVALLFTFDRAFIPIKKLASAAEELTKFGVLCENGKSENHWPAIAEELAEAALKKHHHEARGICMSPTSVSDNWLQADRHWLDDAWSIYDESVK